MNIYHEDAQNLAHMAIALDKLEEARECLEQTRFRGRGHSYKFRHVDSIDNEIAALTEWRDEVRDAAEQPEKES